MDQNDYPDLLVGAYEDDRVFLIRSRPIIGILTRVQPEENLKNIDPNTPGCAQFPDSTEVWLVSANNKHRLSISLIIIIMGCLINSLVSRSTPVSPWIQWKVI